MHHFLDFQSLQSPKFKPGFHIQEFFKIQLSQRSREYSGVFPKKRHTRVTYSVLQVIEEGVFSLLLQRGLHHFGKAKYWADSIGGLRQGCEVPASALLCGVLFPTIICSCQSRMKVTFPNTTTPLENLASHEGKPGWGPWRTTVTPNCCFLTLESLFIAWMHSVSLLRSSTAILQRINIANGCRIKPLPVTSSACLFHPRLILRFSENCGQAKYQIPS